MLKKADGLWVGATWDELQFDLKGNQESRTVNTKVKCPACPELGKTHLNDPSVSIIPSEGKGHCFKCGTKFLIDKNEKADNAYSDKKFKPVVHKNTTVLSESGLAFFRNRRISQEVVKRHRIAQSGNSIAFPYFKGDAVINLKYRGITEKKFFQAEGGTHIVYNYENAMKALTDKRTKDVIITEGEIDTMSFDQAGFPAAVSLDSGAPNAKDKVIDGKFECITNSYDLFEMAEYIYIAMDNDENGKIAERELIRRFGPEKVKLIDFGKYKDGNEALMYEGGEYLIGLMTSAKEIKVSGIFSIEDCFDELMDMVTNGLAKGTTTYMPSIDAAWKWRYGEVNIWTGYNNDGKSTLLRYLEMLKARFDGWKFGLFVPEDMKLVDFMEGLVHMYCGKPTDPEMRVVASIDEIRAAYLFIKDHFFVVDPDGDYTLDTILEKFKYLIRRKGVRVVDIDPYNQVEHQYGKALREDLYISGFMGKLKRFGLQNDVVVNLVAHQTTPERLEAGQNYPAPSKYKIKGGGTFPDKADNVLAVWRKNRQVNPKDRTTTFISEKIKKQKLVGEADLHVDIEYDWLSNRYLDPLLGMKSPLAVQLAINTTTKNDNSEVRPKDRSHIRTVFDDSSTLELGLST